MTTERLNITDEVIDVADTEEYLDKTPDDIEEDQPVTEEVAEDPAVPSTEQPPSTPAAPDSDSPEATLQAAKDAERRKSQEEIFAYRQKLEEVQWQEYQREKQAELYQRQEQWHSQGFSPEEIRQHTISWEELENGKIEIAQQKQAIAQYGVTMEKERRTKDAYIKMYAEQYGVSPDVIASAPNPDIMENMALKHQIATMKQSKTPVTSPDNSVTSSSASPSRERRMDQLMSKDELTDNEHAELGRLTGNR
tara:strand:- start:228 stop:980 length:753 start_codon:yes stop_codon:yes gene_type:complete